jgi:hypothetical protein
MTGCHVGMVTQIQRVAKPGFYRSWCAVHQLDLAVLERLKYMFNESFLHIIHGISGHLRQQKNYLINKMRTMCP